ncbi:hypothetical protein Hanom_Chr16g01475781 [Helianthus anomalus]
MDTSGEYSPCKGRGVMLCPTIFQPYMVHLAIGNDLNTIEANWEVTFNILKLRINKSIIIGAKNIPVLTRYVPHPFYQK